MALAAAIYQLYVTILLGHKDYDLNTANRFSL